MHAAPTLDATTPPARLRLLARQGLMRGPTGSLAPGYQQANVAIVPSAFADAFEGYAAANAAACPLIARGRPGDPALPDLGADIDIRTDLPRYRVFRDGAAGDEPTDIGGLWSEDLVAFAFGCSLGFEADLVEAGVALRCHAPGRTCSAFVSTIDTVPVGVFAGPLVVSMRAVRKDQIDTARRVTEMHPLSHGGPVHVGDPAAIGVDLGRPIDGIGLTDVNEDEAPMFWACGVTTQYALARAALPLAISHYPGHMLVTDIKAGGKARETRSLT